MSISKSAIEDETVNLWDIQNAMDGRIIHPKYGGFIFSVAFSPDGKTLAIARDDFVELWDAEIGQKGESLAGHTDLVTSLAFSSNGKTLISGSKDKSVKLCRSEDAIIER